jgi:3-isopropylmalate/(R)-2-methylmalate dehydratase small subunit
MPIIQTIADQVTADPVRNLVTVDLEHCSVIAPNGEQYAFSIDPMRRESLLNGLDEIGLSLLRESEIAAFQARDKQQRPWVYLAQGGQR